MSKKQDKQPDVAVALHYDGKNAPRVKAKGHDEIAERIREIAREHDVPLHEDAVLAHVLSKIDLGEEIPRSLYIAVAEVIAFAYLLAGKVCPVPQPGTETRTNDDQASTPLLEQRPEKDIN
jgi:flagellar biosynthesis protein